MNTKLLLQTEKTVMSISMITMICDSVFVHEANSHTISLYRPTIQIG